MDDSLEEPWGLLVAKEGREDERVPMLGLEFTVGRGKDCSLCITTSKLVSNRHCVLIRDGSKILLKDTSSNGTLVNGKLLKKNETTQLNNGDTVHLVSKRNHPEQNVSYQYTELRSAESEEDEATLEMTLENDDLEPPPAKRPANEEDVRKGSDDSANSSGVPDVKSKTVKDEAIVKESSIVAEKKESDKEKNPVPSLSKNDSMEEILLCGICQEILHDCISLQPCMHSYCSGCYSGWMDRSSECPQCRVRVERICRNHMVNNLAVAYLKGHPDKKRSDEDLAELDSKNKITKEILYPKRRRGYDPDESVDDDDGDEYDETSSDSEMGSGMTFTSPLAGVFTMPLPTASFMPPPMAICRQCSTYRGGLSSLCKDSTTPYVCPTPASHVMCQCCLQFMPMRSPPIDAPPQKCVLCEKFYCHQYWQTGCSGMACGGGCLKPLKEVSVDTVPRISDNLFETNILRSYLHDNSIGVSDMVKEVITKFESGEYHPPTASGLSAFTSSSPTCKSCCNKILSELVYIYRSEILMDNLPVEAHHRSDCHWGRNCRTQKHNADHARRYNHICEQARI